MITEEEKKHKTKGFTKQDIDELESQFNEETERLNREFDKEQALTANPTPLLLIRGVQSTNNSHLESETEQKTVIDWLTFTANETVDILQQFVNIVIPGCTFTSEGKGTQGYKRIISISLSGERLGLIGFLGTSSKNMLCLTGNGTEKVKSWSLYSYWLSLLSDYSISQIHLALDDYEGKTLTHDIVVNAYQEGKFKGLKSRINPQIEERGITTGKGFNKGRTRNIGKTKGCVKSITGYEKGLEQFNQLFGKIPENEQELLIPKLSIGELNVCNLQNAILDISILKWYRLEVKFHNNNVVLPLDIILNRDSYYSGSYPFCGELLPMVNKKIPERLPTPLETALEEMFINAGNSYGSSIFTALSIAKNEGKDLKSECVAIVKKIMKNHTRLNQKIIKQGALKHIAVFDPKDLETS